MDFLIAFKEYIRTEGLGASGDRLLLAVSGGVDSVVLCECCSQAGLDFVLAHCNFQLRGEESERDEAFVKTLALRYGKELKVKRFDTEAYAAAQKVSVQVAARELRYKWFEEILRSSVSQDGKPALRFLATAHHQDDNIETLLMNFFKGTGIAGLRAILPRQGTIIRPLLFARRSDIEQFALLRGLTWVEDSSNLSDKYTRNYFRHQVIPLLLQLYPGVLQNLGENISRFREIETLYRQSIDAHKKQLLERKGSEVRIPVLKLKKSIPLPTLVYEIIQEFGFSPNQVSGVIGLLDSPAGKYMRSATHRILKDRNWLIIQPLEPDLMEEQGVLIESADALIHFAGGTLALESQSLADQPAILPPAGFTALLDAAAVRFPLLLRKWRPGDYFYPLGLRKKKKLARFFIDNKLSLADKEKVWVLESDKKILWVVGWRIDDRFRITPQTKETLLIKAEPRLA